MKIIAQGIFESKKLKTALIYTIVAMFILASLVHSRKIPDQKQKEDRTDRRINKHNHYKTYSIKKMRRVSEHEGCIYTGPSGDRTPEWEKGQKKGRLLQTSVARNMRILSYFPDDDMDGVNDGLIYNVSVVQLQKNNQVGTHYYSTIIKVYPFPQGQDTKYSGSCGSIPIPAEIGTNGFDVDKFDTVILNTIYSDTNTSSGTLAFAGPCQYIRRPVISQINYRAQKMNAYLNGGNHQWHQLLLITIHQMGHIFGVLGYNYQNYWTQPNGRAVSRLYENPDSNTRLSNQDIIATINGQALYNKLPLVKKIVDDLFKCNETITGAKMTQSLGHWDGTVWLRELMTPSIDSLDNRISDLTLSQFYETGWYADVQITKSWKIARGFNGGCNFMKGNNNTNGDACNIAAGGNQCDIYSNYGGTCTSTGDIIRSTTRTCSINNPLSRCFEKETDTSCLQAICESSTSVKVTVGSEVKYCKKGETQQQITFSGVTYRCPQDYNTFCSAQTCEDWCFYNGVCINGRCNLVQASCRASIKGCIFCSSINRGSTSCSQCQEGLILIENNCIQYDCTQLVGCSNCLGTMCTVCLGHRNLVDGQCVFRECGQQHSNCVSCTQSGNFQTCNSCNQPYTLTNGECRLICDISNCQSCSVSGTSKICSVCNKPYTITSGQCPLVCDISNCMTCSVSRIQKICSTCNQPYTLTNNQCLLICNDSNCQTCSLSGTSKICTACNQPYTFSNGQCPLVCDIPNCQSCSASGISKVCSTCSQPYTISNGQCPLICDFSNCQTCQVLGTSKVCTKCNQPYTLANGLCTLVCDITNCQTCSISGISKVCSKCTQPYTISNGQCPLICDKNCQTCSASGTSKICSACNPPYTFSNGQCSLICDIANCQTCSVSGTSKICSTCNRPYTASNGQCPLICDITNCQTCTVSGTSKNCSTCNQPYTLTNGRCQLVCNIPNCKSCSVSGTLKVCSTCNGDWIKQKNGCISPNISNCRTFFANCSSCTFSKNDLNCVACLNGLVPSPDGQSCIPLDCSSIKNCATCSLNSNNVKLCNSCITGFTIFGSTCQACPSNCEVCVKNSAKVVASCTKCKTGYRLRQGTCIK